MMLKPMNHSQLALILELIDSRRADVMNGTYVVGGDDAQGELVEQLTALYDHLNDPDNEIPTIDLPRQRAAQGSAQPVQFV